MDIDSHVAYGYYLGGEEGNWALEGVDEFDYGPPEGLEWFDYAADLAEHGETSVISQFEDRLLRVIGGLDFRHKVEWSRSEYEAYDAWLNEKAEARKLVKVEFLPGGYLSGDGTRSYVLAAWGKSQEYGDPLYLDLAALEEKRITEGWDALLAEAVAALGVTPKQPKPEWFAYASGGN